ncbi:MAG: NAD-dependent epimerase/dehydratase family protein [Sulfuricaulis sp.]
MLVAGATGFIGCKLVDALHARRRTVFALARDISKIRSLWPQTDIAGRGGDIANAETLKDVCAGVHTVFHLASHYAEKAQFDETKNLHWQVTVEGTRHLLEAAARSGVKRFIYVSSVKAMGEGGEFCLDESSLTEPVSPYGRAKLKAEELVLEAGRKHNMHVCNLRLPLVYGRDNRGSVWRMIAAIDSGWFPPLPETSNRRSMVHVDDVIQALLLAADNLAAHGHTYIVTDGQTYSTRQIYEWICTALHRHAPRWAVPLPLLRFVAHVGDRIGSLSGRRFVLDTDALEKLVGSAWYSSEKISRELGYRPVHTLKDALAGMVAEFRNNS